MIEVKQNFKGIYKENTKCEICKQKDDTTEHLLECEYIKDLNNQLSPENIHSPDVEPATCVNKIMSYGEEKGFKINIVNNK